MVSLTRETEYKIKQNNISHMGKGFKDRERGWERRRAGQKKN